MVVIPLLPFRQWTRYSCGAAVFQACLWHFRGEWLPHRRAIEEVRCRPHGTSFRVVNDRLRARRLAVDPCVRRKGRVRHCLKQGRVVLTDDISTWRRPHFSVIVGETRHHYIVIDPLWGLPVLRGKEYTLQAAQEMFAVGMRGNCHSRPWHVL